MLRRARDGRPRQRSSSSSAPAGAARGRAARRGAPRPRRFPRSRAEGFGYDPARGELWFAGETAEAVLLELEARRRALAAEVDELTRAAGRAPEAPSGVDPATGRRLNAAAGLLLDAISAADALAAAPRGAAARGVDAGASRTQRARREAARARRGGGRPPPRRLGGNGARRPRSTSRRRGSRRRRTKRAGGSKRPVRGARRRRRPRGGRVAGGAARRRRETLGQVNPFAQGGVRRGEGAARGAHRAARGPRGEPRASSRSCATT